MASRWQHVPYPAWWIDAAARRRVVLAKAVDRLRERLPLLAGARGALVFGSYATGTVGPESDLDVILVLEDDATPRCDRYAYAVEVVRLGVPCDLIVYDPDEFDILKTTRNFVAQAVREGVWIDAATPC